MAYVSASVSSRSLGSNSHFVQAQKENPALDAAVEQVATILPDSGLDTDLLRANLSHPNFFKNGQYDVESFVSAFFDGALPVSSSPSAAGAADSAPERPTEPEQPLDERTAFDQIWDETKMRVGKADQSKIIQEPISSDMKKSIIALAEAPDSDEEEEEDFTEQLRPGMRAVSMEESVPATCATLLRLTTLISRWP